MFPDYILETKWIRAYDKHIRELKEIIIEHDRKFATTIKKKNQKRRSEPTVKSSIMKRSKYIDQIKDVDRSNNVPKIKEDIFSNKLIKFNQLFKRPIYSRDPLTIDKIIPLINDPQFIDIIDRRHRTFLKVLSDKINPKFRICVCQICSCCNTDNCADCKSILDVIPLKYQKYWTYKYKTGFFALEHKF